MMLRRRWGPEKVVLIQEMWLLPRAGVLDDVWMGVAFLGNRRGAEMGIAGDCEGGGGYLIWAKEKNSGRLERTFNDKVLS